MVVSTRYLYWRITETLVFQTGFEYVLGYGLFIAELYAWTIMFFGYIQTLYPLERTIVPMPENLEDWPTVDVYIPTYNEELSVVMDTVLAAQELEYPADKMNIYLLDDGGRQAFAAFAARAGVGYIAREEHNHAKAGNLNHAMGLTDGELICVFDCDHIPTTGFLQSTVGGFRTDPGLSMLQTRTTSIPRTPTSAIWRWVTVCPGRASCSTARCRRATISGTPPSSAAPAR